MKLLKAISFVCLFLELGAAVGEDSPLACLLLITLLLVLLLKEAAEEWQQTLRENQLRSKQLK